MKIKTAFAITMLGIIASGFLVSAYFQYAPIKIIDIHNPLKVSTKVVKAGESMIYKGDYCLYRNYPATVARTLVNNSVILLPLVHSVGQIGCHQTNIQVPVPVESEPGLYHLEGIASYQITSTRTINVRFYTETFEIIK